MIVSLLTPARCASSLESPIFLVRMRCFSHDFQSSEPCMRSMWFSSSCAPIGVDARGLNVPWSHSPGCALEVMSNGVPSDTRRSGEEEEAAAAAAAMSYSSSSSSST